MKRFTPNLSYYFLFAFSIGFVADIILFLLSRYPNLKHISSLSPYFAHYNYRSPFLAGITTTVGALLAIGLFKAFNVKNDFFVVFLFFITGVFLDYGLNKMGTFKPHLNLYYRTVGDGLSAVYGGMTNIIAGVPAFYLSSLIKN